MQEPTGSLIEQQETLQGSILSTPAANQTLPTVTVIGRDWSRLRRTVLRLVNPIPWAKEIGFLALGGSLTALVGLIQWVPVYDQLAPDAKLRFSWVTPRLEDLFVGLFLGAGLCLVMYSLMERQVRADVEDVVEHMDLMAPSLAVPKGPNRMLRFWRWFRRRGRAATATPSGSKSPVKVNQGALVIMSASYGADTRTFDVAPLIRDQIRDNRVKLPVNVATMGGDPAPNVIKELRVTYVVGGAEPIPVTVLENQELSIP